MPDLDETLPTRATGPGDEPGARRPGRSRRRRAAKLSLLAAVVVAGAGVVPYVQAAQAPRRERLRQIQEDLDYLAGAAEGRTLYAPQPWVEDLTTYPGPTTSTPAGGVTSSGYLDGRWLRISQFDADALTAGDREVSSTPRTLCSVTGPAGRDSSFHAMRGTRTKTHTVCLDVPGQRARVRVVLYLEDGDATVDLATALPEAGRILDATHYEKNPAAAGALLADPTGWADEVLDSLTVLDPHQYAAEDIYAAEKDAGRYD